MEKGKRKKQKERNGERRERGRRGIKTRGHTLPSSFGSDSQVRLSFFSPLGLLCGAAIGSCVQHKEMTEAHPYVHTRTQYTPCLADREYGGENRTTSSQLLKQLQYKMEIRSSTSMCFQCFKNLRRHIRSLSLILLISI